MSAYLNATCANWKALIFEDYKIVMPLTENKKYGITYLYQPHFTPQLGVFGRNVSETEEQAFCDFLHKNYRFIDIECHAFHRPKLWQGSKQKTTYILQQLNNLQLNQNTKRNCKKAESEKIQITKLEKEQLFDLSGKIIQPFLKQNLHLNTKALVTFDALVKSLFTEGKLTGFSATARDGKVLAIGLFAHNEKQVVYLKGASTDKTASNGAMHLLMREALQYFQTQAVTWFDFGGGQNASMAQFYKGFGAEPQNYFSYRKNSLPFPLNRLKQ